MCVQRPKKKQRKNNKKTTKKQQKNDEKTTEKQQKNNRKTTETQQKRDEAAKKTQMHDKQNLQNPKNFWRFAPGYLSDQMSKS